MLLPNSNKFDDLIVSKIQNHQVRKVTTLQGCKRLCFLLGFVVATQDEHNEEKYRVVDSLPNKRR